MRTPIRRNSDNFTGGNGATTHTQKIPPRRESPCTDSVKNIEELDSVMSSYYPDRALNFWRTTGNEILFKSSRMLMQDNPVLFLRSFYRINLFPHQRAELLYEVINKTSGATNIELDNLPMFLASCEDSSVSRKDFLKRLLQRASARTLGNNTAFSLIKEEIPYGELMAVLAPVLSEQQYADRAMIVSLRSLLRSKPEVAELGIPVWQGLVKLSPRDTYDELIVNERGFSTDRLYELVLGCARNSSEVSLAELRRIVLDDSVFANSSAYVIELAKIAADQNPVSTLQLLLQAPKLDAVLIKVIAPIAQAPAGAVAVLSSWSTILSKIPTEKADQVFLTAAAIAPQAALAVVTSKDSPSCSALWGDTFSNAAINTTDDNRKALAMIGLHLFETQPQAARQILSSVLEHNCTAVLNSPKFPINDPYLLNQMVRKFRAAPDIVEKICRSGAVFVSRLLAIYPDSPEGHASACQEISQIIIAELLRTKEVGELAKIINPRTHEWLNKAIYSAMIEDVSLVTMLAIKIPSFVLSYLKKSVQTLPFCDDNSSYAALVSKVFRDKLSLNGKLSIYFCRSRESSSDWKQLIEDPYSLLVDGHISGHEVRVYSDAFRTLPKDPRRAKILANALLCCFDNALRLLENMAEPVDREEIVQIFSLWSKYAASYEFRSFRLDIAAVLKWLADNKHDDIIRIVHRELGINFRSDPRQFFTAEYIKYVDDPAMRLLLLREAVLLDAKQVEKFILNNSSLLLNGDALNVALHFMQTVNFEVKDRHTIYGTIIQLHRCLSSQEDRGAYIEAFLARIPLAKAIVDLSEHDQGDGYYQFVANLVRGEKNCAQQVNAIRQALELRKFKVVTAMLSALDSNPHLIPQLLDAVKLAPINWSGMSKSDFSRYKKLFSSRHIRESFLTHVESRGRKVD